MIIETLFFELLQVAVGTRQRLSVAPSSEQWAELLDMSTKQALMGVAFGAIDRLPEDQWPPRSMRLQWGMLTQKYIVRNQQLSASCREVAARFAQQGFLCCILKGQGNFANYPEWLQNKRAPGDIDVWIIPKPETAKHKGVDPNRPIRTVVRFCQNVQPAQKIGYIHMDFPVWKDTDIEVHIRPSFLCSPLHNRRLQKWFKEQTSSIIMENREFPIPTNQFNAVYQLLHIYKHLFEEGIGLRQLLDYFFVLKNTPQSEHEAIMVILKKFAVDKFAAAVMYVLRAVFAPHDADSSWMICKPDKYRGQHLLGEVLVAGNFGTYDERNGDIANESHAGRYWRKTKRAFRLFSLYPHESFWQPYFMVYHMAWRTFKLWRYE